MNLILSALSARCIGREGKRYRHTLDALLAPRDVQPKTTSRSKDIAIVATVERFDEALHYIFLRERKAGCRLWIDSQRLTSYVPYLTGNSSLARQMLTLYHFETFRNFSQRILKNGHS